MVARSNVSIVVENKQLVIRQIQAMAQGLQISYEASPYDQLGVLFNRLSGDDVELDDVELLLLELERRGHISPELAVRLHSSYLNAL